MTKIVKEKATVIQPLISLWTQHTHLQFPFLSTSNPENLKLLRQTRLIDTIAWPFLFLTYALFPHNERPAACTLECKCAGRALSLFILVEPRTRSYGRIRLHYPPPPVVNHWENERKPRARALLREQQRRERASERLYKREPFIVCIKATLVNLRCKVCVYVHR